MYSLFYYTIFPAAKHSKIDRKNSISDIIFTSASHIICIFSYGFYLLPFHSKFTNVNFYYFIVDILQKANYNGVHTKYAFFVCKIIYRKCKNIKNRRMNHHE